MHQVTNDPALSLVHEGWNHLQSQRPLAAWSCWRRALLIDPEHAAASEALDLLKNSRELPAAATKSYSFRSPKGEPRRSRWNALIRGSDATDLTRAIGVFEALVESDPNDADAWFNLGLALAWAARNADSIRALDRFVSLAARADAESAVEAWTLAEVVRQGAGSDTLTDDLSHALRMPWRDARTDPIEWLSSFAELQSLTIADGLETAGGHAPWFFEWLDRPMPEPSNELSARSLPRVLATVIAEPDSLRFATPVPGNLTAIDRELRIRAQARRLSSEDDSGVEAMATPLPLAFQDAAVWQFRLPPSLSIDDRARLAREAIEIAFEERWVNHLCQALETSEDAGIVDSLTPLAASRAIAGDPVTLAKLTAAVRYREQLAARPSMRAMYQGYPFDRLRRRLGLALETPNLVEPADITCMPPNEIAALKPESLDDSRLEDAIHAARAVCDRPVLASFEAELTRRSKSS